MAVKTITIDLEAYEALKRRKRRGESFSDVIKEHFRIGATGRVVKAILDDIELDESTLDAVDVPRRSAPGAPAVLHLASVSSSAAPSARPAG